MSMTANGYLGPFLHFILLLAAIYPNNVNGIRFGQKRLLLSNKLYPRTLIRTRKALAMNASKDSLLLPSNLLTKIQDLTPLAKDHYYNNNNNEWNDLELPAPPPFPKNFHFLNPFDNQEGNLLPDIYNTGGSLHSQPQSNHDCGGFLKSRNGIIQTPNFPNIFNTPIDCLWIIDGSEFMPHPGQNITITVHLTQLYVLGGLTFTEYMYYSDDYRVPAQRFYALTEDDVTQLSSLLFNSQYLEIRFRLNSLDGTHLRALDHLLDVYGFNITYEINEPPKNYYCNVLQCRLLGHCFAKKDFR